MRSVKGWVILGLSGILVVFAFSSLFVGASTITPWGLLSANDEQVKVFLISRVPRLAAILVSGVGMSIAGLIMMELARNRFVTPSTAGTVESATLGILVAILFFGSASLMAKMLIAFVFALAGSMIFVRMIERVRFKDVIVVPLIGIMFGGVVGSISTFIAYRFDLLQTLDAWTTGSFSGVLRGRYELVYVAVPVVVAAYLFADRFTLAGMGEEFAVNLGLNYRQVLNLGLSIVAVTTTVVVLTVGSIPFLSLIVPNLATMFMGDNIKRVLPVTALFGAIFVLAADVLGRTVRYPYEIPVGTVMGVLGSALFLVLILRRGAYASR